MHAISAVPDVCPVRRRAAKATLKGVEMISSGRTLTAAGAFGVERAVAEFGALMARTGPTW